MAESLRGGEGIETFVRGFYFLSRFFAELLDGAADGRNRFPLGDNEGNQHFPGVLAEDSYAFAVVRGFREESVFRRNLISKGTVVKGQVEIGLPDVIPYVSGAGNSIMHAFDMRNIEHMAARDEAEDSRGYFQGSEALAAVYDFIEVEIVADECIHNEFLQVIQNQD